MNFYAHTWSRAANGDISLDLLKALAFIKFLEWALASLPEEFHYSGRYVHCVYMRFRIHCTMKCIIIETRADSVVVKSNGLGPVLAAIMHPGRLFNIVVHVS